MPRILLNCYIQAPVERCFDLSRSVELHKLSTQKSAEEAIAGKVTGLLDLHDWVTWRATHLGFRQTLTSRITEFTYPTYFCDEMVKGAFKSFRHEHHFHPLGQGTEMKDIFTFQSPLGILGRAANHLFLTGYMKKLLTERNQVIRTFAETDQWKKVLAYSG
jgi:ligand-binding SRPBCC domain-containing protein